MCNLYTIDGDILGWAEANEKHLGRALAVPAGGGDNITWQSPVYPKYQGLFFRPIDPAAPGGALEPVVGRWGVVPFFHKGPASAWKFPTNNARSEEMTTKASFRDSVKARRCVLPATSFVEWTGPKGSKTKHQITRADGAPLFLAGLWASHTWEGERTESYTMVTQEAGGEDDMAPFHNRQPVVLDSRTATTWLDLTADPMAVVRPPSPGTLAFDPPEPVTT